MYHICTYRKHCRQFTRAYTHLDIGVELCKLHYDVAGHNRQRELKFDFILSLRERGTLGLHPEALLVLEFNGTLHGSHTVVQVDHVDLQGQGSTAYVVTLRIIVLKYKKTT